MSKRDDELAQLRERVAQLERRLQAVQLGTSCLICGGTTNRSNKFPKRYCAQDFGPCGELILRKSRYRSGEREPMACFHRTTIQDDGTIDLLNPMSEGLLHWWFMGGKLVTKEEYAAAKGVTDGS